MKNQTTDIKTYSVPDIEKILGVTRPTVYSRIKDGSLKAFKTGRQWRITEQALKDFMKPENK